MSLTAMSEKSTTKSFKITMNMKHYTDISFHITMEY